MVFDWWLATRLAEPAVAIFDLGVDLFFQTQRICVEPILSQRLFDMKSGFVVIAFFKLASRSFKFDVRQIRATDFRHLIAKLFVP